MIGTTADRDSVLVRRAVDEIWNHGALEVADALFAAAYINHGGLIPDLVRGPEAIKVGVALYRTAFPGLQVAIDDLSADGEMVVLHWTARASPAGVPAILVPPGQGGQLTGITRLRLVGGQIMESWTDWDQGNTLKGLGLMSPADVN